MSFDWLNDWLISCKWERTGERWDLSEQKQCAHWSPSVLVDHVFVLWNTDGQTPHVNLPRLQKNTRNIGQDPQTMYFWWQNSSVWYRCRWSNASAVVLTMLHSWHTENHREPLFFLLHWPSYLELFGRHHIWQTCQCQCSASENCWRHCCFIDIYICKLIFSIAAQFLGPDCY